MLHLDTHVLLWVAGGQAGRMPRRARTRLEQERLAISPMVRLELQYLFEASKVTEPPDTVLQRVAPLEVDVSRVAFDAVVAQAQALDWTRDPFDRVIAATAVADRARLLTADEHLRANLAEAVWDDG